MSKLKYFLIVHLDHDVSRWFILYASIYPIPYLVQKLAVADYFDISWRESDTIQFSCVRFDELGKYGLSYDSQN